MTSAKLLILSDLHLEFAGYTPPPSSLDGVDAVILAGDIMPNARKLAAWAARPAVFGADMPIALVAGNHEFYGGNLGSRRHELSEAAGKIANVHALDPGDLRLCDGYLRILGCTLWTDFALPVVTAEGQVSDRDRAMAWASQYLNDFARIKITEPGERKSRLLRPADILDHHLREREWLRCKLAEPFSGTTVVVTHHGPSLGSVAPRWKANWLSPAFSSDLPDEFFEVPALWVHGHTHDSRDYVRGRTRVLCNPRGYLLRSGAFENGAFDPALAIDI